MYLNLRDLPLLNCQKLIFNNLHLRHMPIKHYRVYVAIVWSESYQIRRNDGRYLGVISPHKILCTFINWWCTFLIFCLQSYIGFRIVMGVPMTVCWLYFNDCMLAVCLHRVIRGANRAGMHLLSGFLVISRNIVVQMKTEKVNYVVICQASNP